MDPTGCFLCLASVASMVLKAWVGAIGVLVEVDLVEGDLVGAAHLEAEAGWDSGVGEVRLVVVCQGFGVRPTET